MNSYWQLQPIFGSYLLVGALIAILLSLLFVSPGFGRLSKRRQRTLVGLRALLILLMLIGMLRPALIITQRRAQNSQLAILFDASRSMQITDGESGASRWQSQLRILQQVMPQLETMGSNFNVELIGFADRLSPQPQSDSGSFQWKAQPDGEQTDLGQALADVVDRYQGKRVAAVVLISDGTQQAIMSTIAPQQAARLLDRRATPLYCIAIGRSRDQSQARDVAIENMDDEYSVFVKNEFVLRVGVRVQGYVKPIAVTLRVKGDGGGAAEAEQVVGPVQVQATEDSQIVMAEFSYRPEEPGQYLLEVTAENQDGELIVDNNQLTAFLTVRDGGVRVLYMTSNLWDEQKFVRQSLAASQDIEVDFLPISVLTERQWPLDIEAEVQITDYDVFLIGDMNAGALTESNWMQIAEQVGEGRGFMMYGGFQSFGPGGYASSPINDLIPIVMDPLEQQSVSPDEIPRADMHLDRPLKVIPVTDNPVMHLAPRERNADVWRELQPLLGANRFGRLKDRTRVIAVSDQDEPLLVEANFIAGRVLAFAGDSTYRWWKYGQQEQHKRFWRQAILWLAQRDTRDANSIWIDLPQRHFRAGTRVQFETGVTNQTGDPVSDAKLVAKLTLPDGSEQTISLSAKGDGQIGLVPETEVPGVYRIDVALDPLTNSSIDAPDGETPLSARSSFLVLKQDFELSDRAANPGLLDMLAKATSRVGGKSIAPEQLAPLLQSIKDNPPRDEVETQSKHQLGDHPVGTWAFYLLIATVLIVEWFLRKQWHLV